MGILLPANVVCDKCGERAAGSVALTKLTPHPEMYLRLPEAWAVSSRPESGELLITCPNCPPTLVTVAPPPPDDDSSR